MFHVSLIKHSLKLKTVSVEINRIYSTKRKREYCKYGGYSILSEPPLLMVPIKSVKTGQTGF